MNNFEIRYNAVEAAKFVMIQRLLVELARLHGTQGEAVIDRFRTSTITSTEPFRLPACHAHLV